MSAPQIGWNTSCDIRTSYNYGIITIITSLNRQHADPPPHGFIITLNLIKSLKKKIHIHIHVYMYIHVVQCTQSGAIVRPV